MEPEEEPGGAAVREVYEEVRRTLVFLFFSHRLYFGILQDSLLVHKQGTLLHTLRRRQEDKQVTWVPFCCLVQHF